MMLKFPSKSDWVPVDVPCTIIFTPATGIPESSETVPETVLSCAKVTCTKNANNSVKIPLNFVFILIIIWISPNANIVYKC